MFRLLARLVGSATRATIVAVSAVVLIGGVWGYADYSATQGTGTTFGSLVASGVHYAKMLICDQVDAATCATVDANNSLSVSQATAANLNATVVGTGTFATQAAQTGTWTVQPGNTANTTAWLVTGTGGTFPATQSGTWTVQPGNTPNTSPWLFTIQQGGNPATVTASNALKVDGSAVTQPVSQATSSNLKAQVDPLTAASWAIGATGAAVPANARYGGVNVGGNLTGVGGLSAGADASSNSLVGSIGYARPSLWNGTTWDRMPGDATNGAYVNIKTCASGICGITDGSSITSVSPIGVKVQTSAPGYSNNEGRPPSATIRGGMWVNLDTWGGTALGAPANFGSSPGAVVAASTNSSTFFGTTSASANSGAKDGGTLRVVLATDQPAMTNAQPVNMTTWGGTTLGTPTNFGTSPGAVVAGSTNASQFQGTTAVVAEPCQTQTKSYLAISQATSTQLFVGTSAKKTYVCHFFSLGADAENVSLVSGTGSVCGTGTAAMIGGTTAAAGPNLAANSGFAVGTGSFAVAVSGANADNVCLLQSGSGRIAGVMSYVSQ